MKKPDNIKLIHTLLSMEAIPLKDGENPGEHLWIVYPVNDGAPPMLLTIEGEKTQDYSHIEREIMHWRASYDVPKIRHFQTVSRQAVYAVRVRLLAFAFTVARNLVIYPVDDSIWVEIAYAGLDVGWYQPIIDARRVSCLAAVPAYDTPRPPSPAPFTSDPGSLSDTGSPPPTSTPSGSLVKPIFTGPSTEGRRGSTRLRGGTRKQGTPWADSSTPSSGPSLTLPDPSSEPSAVKKPPKKHGKPRKSSSRGKGKRPSTPTATN